MDKIMTKVYKNQINISDPFSKKLYYKKGVVF